jgi:hypothetical protein
LSKRRIFAWFVAAIILSSIAAGCSSTIVGETNKLPPKGGPKGSDRHPPGLTQEEINK